MKCGKEELKTEAFQQPLLSSIPTATLLLRLKFTFGILFFEEPLQCMGGEAIDKFIEEARHCSVDLIVTANAIELHTLISSKVYDAWMVRYNKIDLTDVEFRMYQPTSGAVNKIALMPVVDPSRTAGGESIFVGFSNKNSDSSYSQTISYSRLTELVQMYKKKIPQVYFRFMTLNPVVINSKPQSSLKPPRRRHLSAAATQKRDAAMLCGGNGITYMNLFLMLMLFN